jgi:hypothetical protein
MEFEKLGTWFDRVHERDWFDAPHRREAERWLRRCERMLEGFEAKVFELHGAGLQADADGKSRLRVIDSLPDAAAEDAS